LAFLPTGEARFLVADGLGEHFLEMQQGWLSRIMGESNIQGRIENQYGNDNCQTEGKDDNQ